jgi:hypothetical protein
LDFGKVYSIHPEFVVFWTPCGGIHGSDQNPSMIRASTCADTEALFNSQSVSRFGSIERLRDEKCCNYIQPPS